MLLIDAGEAGIVEHPMRQRSVGEQLSQCIVTRDRQHGVVILGSLADKMQQRLMSGTHPSRFNACCDWLDRSGGPTLPLCRQRKTRDISDERLHAILMCDGRGQFLQISAKT